MIAQGAVGELPGDERVWTKFWRRFTAHDAKSVNFTSMVAAMVEDPNRREEFTQQLDRHVQADQDRKFAGLYAEVHDDGSVVSPTEAIDTKMAANLLSVLGFVIRSHAQMWEGVDLHKQYRRAQPEAARMVDALKSRDVQRTRQTWRETSRRGGEE
jgi:hypothetical protein